MFLPLQQDFYTKSRYASPQNSSQIYAYAWIPLFFLLKQQQLRARRASYRLLKHKTNNDYMYTLYQLLLVG